MENNKNELVAKRNEKHPSKFNPSVVIGFLKKNLPFIFRERGREGERQGEKHQSVAS